MQHGARVINLSIGGVRDPLDPELDSFSPAEQDAVEYAYSKGVLVVAAVGNGTQAPKTPWEYADYPAALPHVLGVGAVRQNGAVPDYSNRDARFVDIAAPGGPIFSTIPRNLVDATLPGCARRGRTRTAAPSEFQDGIGTSFAAPQVAAAAALLIGGDPSLTPDQVEWLLERSATDANAVDRAARPARSGATRSPAGAPSTSRRRSTCSGTARTCRQADAYEPNDDAGATPQPFGRSADDLRDARLLGRSGRRLLDQPREGRAGLRPARALDPAPRPRCCSGSRAPGTSTVPRPARSGRPPARA